MTGHAAPPDARTRGWALLALFMAVFLGSLDQSIANTALPAIAAALQRTPAESVWVIHAYQLAVVAVPPRWRRTSRSHPTATSRASPYFARIASAGLPRC